VADISISPLTDRDAFLERWAGLYERAGDRSFFLSPPWMAAWLGGAPDGSDLRIVEAGGARDLLLGLFCLRRRAPPLFGLREARLHEFGEDARDAVYVEHNGFLVAKDAPADLRRKAVDAALTCFACADAAVFRNIAQSLADDVKAAAAQRGLSARILREQPVYVVDLAQLRAGRGDFIASFSASLRGKIRRAIRLYEERGPVRCQIASSSEEIDEAWREMAALHQQSWRARGRPGAFANPQFNAFHERLKAAAPGAFQLMKFCAGKETLGVLYNFLWDKRVSAYQSGFSYEKDNRLAPGYVCHALAAQRYLDEGYDVYDFLAGDDDYKRRMGGLETRLCSLAIDNPTWRNRLRRLVRG
jgi:CelD/BcsL family acetyltransferase involved in cellulose biosynthesis